MVFSQQGDARRRALNAGTTANDEQIDCFLMSRSKVTVAAMEGQQVQQSMAGKLGSCRPAAAAAAVNNGS
jgi:hypothetical protein